MIYFTGVTYSSTFDKTTDLDLPDAVLGAMGMSMSNDHDPSNNNNNSGGDCFLGILKLPTPHYSDEKHPGRSAWWKNNSLKRAKMIYARKFGTRQNSEACSSLLSLSYDAVDDSLLQSPSQRKIVLLGHVNPVPLSEAELERLRAQQSNNNNSNNGGGGGGSSRQLLQQDGKDVVPTIRSLLQQEQSNELRSLQQSNNMNQGGLFSSLSETLYTQLNDGGPLTKNGRAYGFLIDFDVSLTQDQDFMTFSLSSSPTTNFDLNYAYGALLGGHVLESSPLVYPVDFTQNGRDPNQLYVVSMHSDNENEVYNPEYTTSAEEEVNANLLARPDVILGGAGGATTGGDEGLFVGGVPKYGSEFYVKVEQVTLTPSEELKNVEPTSTEHVRHTMKSGWGFGFKLNDAADVRPSCVEFVKGRTPNEDVLLMGGTTRKMTTEDGSGGVEEYDGFITKIIPPSPSPVLDKTTGQTLEEAKAGIQNEGMHPTKRIDSTSGRDETVTAICLPPSNAGGMGVTHAYVVGSSTNPEGGKNGPSMAYLLKMRLDDMSTVWKEHVTSISFDGDVGGDVLGQGCAVSHDGKAIYLSGTIDGASGMRTGAANADVKPRGGSSDIFVVAYDTEFGNVSWERQLGTQYEDKLARGGGINVDSEGNPIIMGSSRGALQRPREGTGRMASDVFVMSLSRENGVYINAPFTTGKIASTIAAAGSISIGIGSVSGVMIAAIVITVIFALFAVIVVRKRRKVQREQVSRVWQGSGDDFNFDNPSVGADEDRTSSGALRIVRGGTDDGWDDGSDRLNKEFGIWTSVSGGSENSSPKRLMSSYSRKTNEDDISFLAKLREEAAASKKRLTSMISSDTTDPRVDGGASIKDMLSQYREVKKNNLMTKSLASAGKKTPDRSKLIPPPPPPRRNYEDEPDGLSEFTII